MDKHLYIKMCHAGHMMMELVATRTIKPMHVKNARVGKDETCIQKGRVHCLNLQHQYFFGYTNAMVNKTFGTKAKTFFLGNHWQFSILSFHDLGFLMCS